MGWLVLPERMKRRRFMQMERGCRAIRKFPVSLVVSSLLSIVLMAGGAWGESGVNEVEVPPGWEKAISLRPGDGCMRASFAA